MSRHCVRRLDPVVRLVDSHSVLPLRSRHFVAALACTFAIGRASTNSTAPASLEWGPLAHSFGLTLEPGRREEWLGPLYSTEDTGNGSHFLSIVPPLFVRETNPSVELERYDILYPALTYSSFGTEYRWQLFQLFAFSGGHSIGEDESKRRFTLFPFFFYQRSSTQPTNNYTALVPLYGTMRNHLFRDEVRFVLMPLYVHTRKGQMETDNYLLPFFHHRHGGGYDGWQFWPVVGNETKALTYRTNNLEEAELIPGHQKRFLFWPIFHQHRTGLGGPNPETNTVVFPLFAHQRSPNRDQSQYLIPFFTVIDDREKKYKEWGFPWPLVDFARGEGKTGNRVWPLFSEVRSPSAESRFYLWPLFMQKGVHSEQYARTRSRVLFFLWSDVREENRVAKTERRRRDLWPLFTHKHDYNGNERLQILAPLEPFVPNVRGVERGWSPVWSLYRDEHNAKEGTRSQSFLWNLWRRESEPGASRTSFLFGAVKTERTEAGRRWGLFRRGNLPSAGPTATSTTPQ